LLQPEHLSLYALTLEEGTSLYRWVERGLVFAPDDDLAADMYEWASERLQIAGYSQYEISNWARNSSLGKVGDAVGSDFRCRHNLQYWHNLPYFGFGAGAHGYIQGVRTANVNGILEYISRIRKGESRTYPLSPANNSVIPIDHLTEIKETMMVGLRLTDEGVDRGQFKQRFGREIEAIFPSQILRLERDGLVEFFNTLRLTKRGRLLGNRVFSEFVNAEIDPSNAQ
jgi:oxygen-independent coproporphyrinogen-3 oxidase